MVGSVERACGESTGGWLWVAGASKQWRSRQATLDLGNCLDQMLIKCLSRPTGHRKIASATMRRQSQQRGAPPSDKYAITWSRALSALALSGMVVAWASQGSRNGALEISVGPKTAPPLPSPSPLGFLVPPQGRLLTAPLGTGRRSVTLLPAQAGQSGRRIRRAPDLAQPPSLSQIRSNMTLQASSRHRSP